MIKLWCVECRDGIRFKFEAAESDIMICDAQSAGSIRATDRNGKVWFFPFHNLVAFYSVEVHKK